MSKPGKESKESFEEAGSRKNTNVLSEILAMLMQNKKYWLLPILIVLLGLGALIVLSGSQALAPFIYSIF